MEWNKRFLLTVLFFSMVLFTKAVGIKINAPEYAGTSLVFYTIPNFLSETQVIVGEGTVDKNGLLNIKIEIPKTSTVYSEFGVYKCWFVADSEKDYELIMPPFEEKKSTSPYVKLKLFHIGIKNAGENDVNVMIEDFMRQYSSLLSKNYNQIFYRRSLEDAEKVIAELQTKYPDSKNAYFENFKTYKYGAMKYMALIQEPTPIMQEYFINKPIVYDLPEYSELFDKLFRTYLQYATQQVNGQKINVMLNSGAYEQLIDWLTTDIKFNKELAEAIILKSAKPLFFSKKFNTNSLFNILLKISTTSKLETHKITAEKIHKELARTMYGAIAPELNLVDINGAFVNWENFDGKYVYLCFTRTDNEKFSAHKDLLREIQKKHSKNLAVVIVIEDDEIEKNADLLKCDGFEWTVLRGMTRREVYESFNVRMMPTYLLIDPQGRMAGSQAPWPDENFELQFSNVLKATSD